MQPTNPYLNDTSDKQVFYCEWANCDKTKFVDLTLFLGHLLQHGIDVQASEEQSIVCEWSDCTDEFDQAKMREFQLHLSYHGYHSKLMSYGATEIRKISTQIGKSVRCYIDSSARTVLPVLPDSFICGWKRCFQVFYDAESFYRHVERHPFDDVTIPKNIPKPQLKQLKFADCKWNDCTFQTNSRWHLKDHLRSHTQEKMVACPNCGSMFCSKFKLGDHVLRQYLNENFTNEHLQTLLLQVSNDKQQLTLTLIPSINSDKESADDNTGPPNDASNRTSNGVAAALPEGFSSSLVIDGQQPTSSAAKKSKKSSNKTHISANKPVQDPTQFSTALGQFKCENCDKVCATKSLLREHAKSHFESYVYQCELCPFKSPSPSGIQHHKKYRHSDERPFNCQFCDAKFKSKSDLRKHIDIHSSETPFKCSLCSFECRCCHTLNRHQKIVHENSKQIYECHLCDRKFTRGNNLSRHLTKTHKLEIPNAKTRFVYKRDPDNVFRVQL